MDGFHIARNPLTQTTDIGYRETRNGVQWGDIVSIEDAALAGMTIDQQDIFLLEAMQRVQENTRRAMLDGRITDLPTLEQAQEIIRDWRANQTIHGTGTATPMEGWKVQFNDLEAIGRIDWINIYNNNTGQIYYSGPPIRRPRNTTEDW